MPKAGLVPVKKQIKAKHPYVAIRYINPEEKKRRVKEFLEARKKASEVSRSLEKNPLNATILYPDELKKEIPVAKNGEQYYKGNPDAPGGSKKISVPLSNIIRVLEFKEPINGIITIAHIKQQLGSAGVPGKPSWVRQYISEKTEKLRKTKFKRIKNVGKGLDDYRAKYNKLQQSKSIAKKELGVVLNFLDRYEMRIGGSPGGVTEKKVQVEDLKLGMVVVNESLGEKAVPQLVVMDKEKGGFQLRNMKTKEDHSIPEKVKELTMLGHYGASDLEVRHVRSDGSKVFLDMIGKSGVWQQIEIKDKKLASLLLSLREGKDPKDKLFPSIKRSTVTKVLDKYKIRPHDFRSYHATKAYVEEQANYPTPTTKKELKEVEKAILTTISEKLWNKPATAGSSYVDPVIRATWKAGLLEKIIKKAGIGLKKSLLVIVERPMDEGDRKVQIMNLNEAFTSFQAGWA